MVSKSNKLLGIWQCVTLVLCIASIISQIRLGWYFKGGRSGNEYKHKRHKVIPWFPKVSSTYSIRCNLGCVPRETGTSLWRLSMGEGRTNLYTLFPVHCQSKLTAQVQQSALNSGSQFISVPCDTALLAGIMALSIQPVERKIKWKMVYRVALWMGTKALKFHWPEPGDTATLHALEGWVVWAEENAREAGWRWKGSIMHPCWAVCACLLVKGYVPGVGRMGSSLTCYLQHQ